MKEAEERTLGDGVASLIGDKKALLLLDNLEQIVSAAPEVAGLVEQLPGAADRDHQQDPARIAAEREYPLAPLALPPSSDRDSTESLMAYPAVALFVERASTTQRLVRADVRECRCRRGRLPAPGRSSACSRARCRPTAAPVPGGAARAARPRPRCAHVRPARHSRAAADAARHDRLEPLAPDGVGAAPVPADGRVRRRVHPRRCRGRLRGAGETSLDELESLVDKALVQMDGQGDRLRMLQTIGEYARERLEAARRGERDRAEARPPVCGARARDPRRHRGHRPDRSPSNAGSPRRATSRPRSTRSWRRRRR